MGYLEIVNVLVDNHSFLEMKDIIGRTPLYMAIKFKYTRIV